MADLFFSYAREDAHRVQQLAEALADRGWSVWWDRSITPGSTFDEVIEDELDKARCVVVLWSHASISSTWVKEEAEEGLQRGILTPVLVEDVRPPLGFRRVQAADLRGWEGEPTHDGYLQLVHAIHKLIGGGEVTDNLPPRPTDVTVAADERPLLVADEAATNDLRAAAPRRVEQPPPLTQAPEQSRRRRLSLWLVPVLSLLSVSVAYLAFAHSLRIDGDRVTARVDGLLRQPGLVFVADEPRDRRADERRAMVRLRSELAGEINAGLVSIFDDDANIVIRASGDKVFRSGSAEVEAHFKPVLIRIGQLLGDQDPSSISVSGHTDNIPIRSLRFPSNQVLSDARAQAVADVLATQVDAQLRVDGFGDARPLANNGTRAGRALNRRVEIEVRGR